jgi:hypothetical protein
MQLRELVFVDGWGGKLSAIERESFAQVHLLPIDLSFFLRMPLWLLVWRVILWVYAS